MARVALIECLQDGAGHRHLVKVAPTHLQVVPVGAQCGLGDGKLADALGDVAGGLLIAVAVQGQREVGLLAQRQAFAPVLGHLLERAIKQRLHVAAHLHRREQRTDIDKCAEATVVFFVLTLTIMLECFFVIITQGALQHLVDLSIVLEVAQMLNLANQLQHLAGGVVRRCATGIAEPGEPAIAHLQFFQRGDDALALLAHLLCVKQFVQARHAQGLAVGLTHPRRGEQGANLQVLVFGEHRHQGGVLCVGLPVVDGFTHLWLDTGHTLCHLNGK